MLIAAIVIGVITAISTFAQAEAQRRQQEYQAEVARANAMAKEQQARLTRDKAELDRKAVEKEQHDLTRQFRASEGENISLLAAGSVAMAPGTSALDVLEGNVIRYADDMGQLEVAKEMHAWEGGYAADTMEWEADVMRSNASFLSNTAGSFGQSLLTAGLAGAASGFSAYSAGGGFQKVGTATNATKGVNTIPKGALNNARFLG